MVDFGQYPLVYQLQNGVPIGLAETSSLSAVNLVVSSISAIDYLGLTSTFQFTGVVSVGDATSIGNSLVDNTNYNNPKIRPIAVTLNDFMSVTTPDNSITIGYGSTPLAIAKGGTAADNVTQAQINLSLEPNVDVQVYNANLTQLSNLTLTANKILVGGAGTLTDITAPTNNTFLKYSGGSFIWTGVDPGGSNSFPTPGGRIPVTNSTTVLDTFSDLTYTSNVLKSPAVCAADVCAATFNEGGTLLSTKYQGKDDTLTTIASLNPGANELIYFTNTNAATTTSLTEQGRNLLDDTTFAAMRTTLQLSALATKSQVNLASVEVTNTLPITNGGTAKISFNPDQLIFSNDFSQDSTLTFNKTTKLLNASSFSATNVSANTIYEGGQSLVSKYQPVGSYLTSIPSEYLTQAEGDVLYQPGDVFLTTLATQDTVNLATAQVCGTLPTNRGGTNKTSFNANRIIYGEFDQNANLTFDGTTIFKSPTVCATTVCGADLFENGVNITTKYETQTNATNTYLTKSTYNIFTGTLALSAGLKDVDLTTPPTNNQVLKWNDTAKRWKAADDSTGVGGGTPGGNSTNVQINFEGNFSGNAGLTYNLDTSTLRAQFYSNLPSGDPIWNARQLSGIPLVSGILNPTPQDGDVLTYLVSPGVPTTGWYYAQPGGSTAGGNDTQIQFNNGGAFSGSPALVWQNSTSSLISKQLSATTVSAGTIHVGGSDGYIRNNNGSIGISSIGGSVSISGTNSVSLQGIAINNSVWPEAGTGPGIIFYDNSSQKLLNVRTNSTAVNGTRNFTANTQGYIVASYLTSASDDYFGLNPVWNYTVITPGNVVDLPSNKDVLTYNNNIYNLGGAVKGWTWEQLSLSGGYLSDVATTTPQVNDVLVRNGTNWAPSSSINLTSVSATNYYNLGPSIIGLSNAITNGLFF